MVNCLSSVRDGRVDGPQIHDPSQTRRTFLRNHADAIAAINLCVVPTLTSFAFLVAGHGRRQLLWFAVTRHATADWLAQQVVQAFPWNTAPTYWCATTMAPRAGLHKSSPADGDAGPPDITEAALRIRILATGERALDVLNF